MNWKEARETGQFYVDLYNRDDPAGKEACAVYLKSRWETTIKPALEAMENK